MGNINYDVFGGYLRVAKAVEKLDFNVSQAILLHAALEHELELVLEKSLPRVAKLGGLGFEGKLRVVHSAWKGSEESADLFFNVVLRFNNYRNALAHQNADAIEGCRKSVLEAYRKIDENVPDDVDMAYVVQGMCAYIGDGPMPEQIKNYADGMAAIIAAWPIAVGQSGKKD